MNERDLQSETQNILVKVESDWLIVHLETMPDSIKHMNCYKEVSSRPNSFVSKGPFSLVSKVYLSCSRVKTVHIRDFWRNLRGALNMVNATLQHEVVGGLVLQTLLKKEEKANISLKYFKSFEIKCHFVFKHILPN